MKTTPAWKALATALAIVAIFLAPIGCEMDDDSHDNDHPSNGEQPANGDHPSNGEQPANGDHPSNSEQPANGDHPE